jgi:hypothetical protein
MRRTTNILGVVLILSALGPACGGAQSGGGGRRSGAVISDAHLPSHLSWARLGATTLEEAREHFTAENLYTTESLDSTMGGERENVDRTRGPNAGVRFNRFNVVRSTNADGYIGDLGDDYGAVTFYFTRLPGSETPVLFRLEIAQRPGATPSVCEPARAFAEVPEALQGCSERMSRPARVEEDGGYTFCVEAPVGELQATVHCAVGREGSSMGDRVEYVLIVPGLGEEAEE